MKVSSLKKKIAAVISAGMLGTTIAFTAVPVPAANASILGALIGTGIQIAAVEQQLGYLDKDGRHELNDSMRQQYGVNDDPELNERLDTIMQYLTAGIGSVDPSIYDKPYNYFINNDTSFNAFCSLGHNISVNTGLFNLVNNDDEIAVVIAHEMAHGQKNHVVKGFHKTIPVALGSAVLAESTGGIGGAVLATVLNNQITAKSITKPQEWEADNLAFDYLNNTPYNPGACAAIWQRVMEKMNSSDSQNFVGEIFSPSDHPTNIQRRDNYSKKLTELSDNHVTVADGIISINGKTFLSCANNPDSDMSAAERSYLIAGNLAKLYKGTSPKPVENKKKTTEENGEYKKRKFSFQSDNNSQPEVRPLPQVAYAEDGMLFIDENYIMTEIPGEPSAVELAALFNTIK